MQKHTQILKHLHTHYKHTHITPVYNTYWLGKGTEHRVLACVRRQLNNNPKIRHILPTELWIITMHHHAITISFLFYFRTSGPCPVSSRRGTAEYTWPACHVLPTVTRSNLCPRPRFSLPDPPSLFSRSLPAVPRWPCPPCGHPVWQCPLFQQAGAGTAVKYGGYCLGRWDLESWWWVTTGTLPPSHPGPRWCHGATCWGISPPQSRPTHPSEPQLAAAHLARLKIKKRIVSYEHPLSPAASQNTSLYGAATELLNMNLVDDIRVVKGGDFFVKKNQYEFRESKFEG